jgi:cyclophilin family peptidyl-prolyl cis-trans isomerase
VRVLVLVAAGVATVAAVGAQPAAPLERAPRIRFETSAGTFVIETYPLEAPKTVAHVTSLVKTGFYDGQRVHRSLPGFVVQFGDPQTRDESARSVWGRGTAGSSGTPIGVAEITEKRTHRAGAVGVAHMGLPAKADSQIYITLDVRRELDGQYAVFGQVVEGWDVPSRLRVGDTIIRATTE